MITAQLHPHPTTISTLIDSLTVSIEWLGHQLDLSYLLTADIPNLCIPEFDHIQRADDLWQHSCFELFVRKQDNPAYQEFNFSPSGGWAHYRFSDYRNKLPDDQNLNPPEIQVEQTPGRLVLKTSVSLEPETQFINLSAVIEDQIGALSYWALNHPADKPDFHHPDAFTLELE